jgi:GIY-YIG catalytic domain
MCIKRLRELSAIKNMNYFGVIYQGELNGKLYVGQHVGMDVEVRWKEHVKPSSGCIKFRNAIQKHGKDKVVWSIIAYCKVSGQNRLNAMERYFIKKKKSLSPNGYNLTKGGHGGLRCEETKQKMSEAATKKFQNTDAREKAREATKKHYAENPEAREKQSEAQKKIL